MVLTGRSVRRIHSPVLIDPPTFRHAADPVPMLERMIGISSSGRKVECLDATPGTRSRAIITPIRVNRASPRRADSVYRFVRIERRRKTALPREVRNACVARIEFDLHNITNVFFYAVEARVHLAKEA